MEIFDNDTDLVEWVQRLVGSCAIGSADAELVAFLTGGNNGKSLMLKVLLHSASTARRSASRR